MIRSFTPAADDPDSGPVRPSRAQRVADRVMQLDQGEVALELADIVSSLQVHHRNIERVLLRRFRDISGALLRPEGATYEQGLLIAAYFSEEYSFEAAALFNPSIVPHPDQTRAPAGGLRFILSLRGVGEGSVSSVTFRTGAWSPGGRIVIDVSSRQAVSPHIAFVPGEVHDDPGVQLVYDDSRDPSEVVIFPVTSRQRNGIEDLRMVRFVDDDGHAQVLGAYTALDSGAIRQELLRTTDFRTFDLRGLRGRACDTKGMALFPRRIAGRYAMLGRQDHETVRLLTSEDLDEWSTGPIASRRVGRGNWYRSETAARPSRSTRAGLC